MRIIKYVLMLYLLGALVSIIRFVFTPIEETMTIQKSIFWLLITWSIFGLIYITIIITRDWDEMMTGRTR